MRILLLLGLITACSGGGAGSDSRSASPSPPEPERLFNMGVTFSPRGNLANSGEVDFVDFFTGTAHGEIKALHTPWRDDEASAGSIPDSALQFMQQQQDFGFVPVVGFGWTNGEGMPVDRLGNDFLSSASEPANNSWSNTETRNEFKAMLSAFAGTYKPRYLFLGNETNAYFLSHSQAQWDDWVTMFAEAYDAIKAVSPETIVYTTFQLERMKGLGVKTGQTYPEHFELLADHLASGKIDAFAFTSYPYLEYDSPADMPMDYYSSLINRVGDKKIIYSELGWIATTVGPFQGSEVLQSEFVDRFFLLNEAVESAALLEAMVWLFLYDFTDYSAFVAFTDVALRSNSGDIIRLADERWRHFVQLSK